MAVTYKGLTIKFGGDTTGLSNALRTIQKEAKTTQSELRAINNSLKFNPGNTELLRQKQQALNETYTQTKQKLDGYKQALSQLEAKKASGEKLTEQEERQYNQLQRSILTCENQLDRYGKELKEVTIEHQASQTGMYKFGQKLETVSSKFSAVGEKLKSTGRTLSTTVTPALAGLGGVSVKTAADFDEQMSKVKAISGATGKDFDALRAKAREMGSKTKFSASEAGEGMEYMAMAGWKAKDMIRGLPGILNLAAASGEDLGTTSDIVTDALTAFGLKAKDAGHFADVLAKASSASNTNVSMMGETFKYAAPVAGSLGYSVEDTSIAIGLMANAGIKASNSGTALRTLLTNMAKPSKDAAEAMDTMGVSLQNSDGSMKSFKEVMDDLRAGFGNLKMPQKDFQESLSKLDKELADGNITQKQYDKMLGSLMKSAYGAEGALKAEAAASLAGKTGMSGLLAIVNASESDYQKLTKEIYNADGAAESMAETMQDNLNGQLTTIKSALEELAISVGDRVMPHIRNFANGIKGLVDRFNALTPAQKDVVIAIGGITAAAGPALLIAGSTISALGKIGSGFKAASVAITAMKNSQLLANIATKAGAVAQGALNAVMSLNPAAKIVLAISALVGALVYFFTQTEEGRKLWAAFTGALKEKFDAFVKWIQPKIEAVKNFFGGLFDKAKEIGKGIGGAWDTLKKNTGAAFEGIKKGIDNKMTEMKKNASIASGAIKDVLSGNWQAAATKAGVLFGNMKKGMVDKLTSARDTIANIADRIGEKLGFKGLGDKVRNVFNNIIDFVRNPLQKAKEIVKNAVDKIKSIFKFKWSLPNLKLPHIKVGRYIEVPVLGTIPDPSTLKVEWYANGGAIEPNKRRLIGVGDSPEREWIEPESKLLSLIKTAVAQTATASNVSVAVNVTANVTGSTNAYQLGQNIGKGIESVMKQRGL